MPSVSSRLRAQWRAEFAEALSCGSAVNRWVHSPPDLQADLYHFLQDECAVGVAPGVGDILALVTSCFKVL